jgi:hypothetical protein
MKRREDGATTTSLVDDDAGPLHSLSSADMKKRNTINSNPAV